MKAMWNICCGLVMVLATAQLTWAQDAAAKDAKATAKADVQTDRTAVAEKQAELHRTMAELIVARNADQPDQELIGTLTKEVQTLRQELWQAGGVAGMPRGQGGPNFGNCPNPLGPLGPGPRAGQGRGRGYCRGGNCPFADNTQAAAQSYGPGNGRGQGMGLGPGMGRGRGMGRGQGMGRGAQGGRGAGMGRGPWWNQPADTADN